MWSLMCHLLLVSLCTQHSTIMMMRRVVLYCTGLYPVPEAPVYSAAKSGVISYTRAMRVSSRLACISLINTLAVLLRRRWQRLMEYVSIAFVHGLPTPQWEEGYLLRILLVVKLPNLVL